jgi:hypothetical protein
MVMESPANPPRDASELLEEARKVPAIATIMDAYGTFAPFAPMPVVALVPTSYATGANG